MKQEIFVNVFILGKISISIVCFFVSLKNTKNKREKKRFNYTYILLTQLKISLVKDIEEIKT